MRLLEPHLYQPTGGPPKSGIQVKIVDLYYQAKSWSLPRRVVAKSEWHRGELFPRIGFVVTSSRLPAGKVTKVYNGRGDVENRIKEGKNTLRWDKTSCQRFEANQARLQMGVLADNLLHMIRQFYVWGEEVRRSIDWLIKRLIKVGPGSLTTPAGGMCMLLQPFPWRTIIGRCWPGASRPTGWPKSASPGGGLSKIWGNFFDFQGNLFYQVVIWGFGSSNGVLREFCPGKPTPKTLFWPRRPSLLNNLGLYLVLSPKTVTVPTTGQNMVVYVVSLEYRGNEEALAELGYQIARRRIEHQIKMEQIEAEARRLLLPPQAEPPEEQEEVAQEFYPEGMVEDDGLKIKVEEVTMGEEDVLRVKIGSPEEEPQTTTKPKGKRILRPVPGKEEDSSSLF
jgi:hypothetical protein